MSKNMYCSKSTSYFSQSRREMLQFIPSNACRLLEVGCGRGEFMAGLKSQRKVYAVGIEPFTDAAEAASLIFDVVHTMAFEDALKSLGDDQFDCVILNDVLEHLLDPWKTLELLRPSVARGGHVVASIPNVRYWPVLSELVLHASWIYQDHGVLDRTHLRFFTASSIGNMFRQAGYCVVELTGINPIDFTWKQALLNTLASGRLNDTRFMQYACIAKVSD